VWCLYAAFLLQGSCAGEARWRQRLGSKWGRMIAPLQAAWQQAQLPGMLLPHGLAARLVGLLGASAEQQPPAAAAQGAG
jgi:hypothetical protein